MTLHHHFTFALKLKKLAQAQRTSISEFRFLTMTVAELGFRSLVFVAVEFRFPSAIRSVLIHHHHLRTKGCRFLYCELGIRRVPFAFPAMLLVLVDGSWLVHSLLILSCMVRTFMQSKSHHDARQTSDQCRLTACWLLLDSQRAQWQAEAVERAKADDPELLKLEADFKGKVFYDSDEGGGTLRIITDIAYNKTFKLWVACTHRANDDGPPADNSA